MPVCPSGDVGSECSCWGGAKSGFSNRFHIRPGNGLFLSETDGYFAGRRNAGVMKMLKIHETEGRKVMHGLKKLFDGQIACIGKVFSGLKKAE